MATISYPTFTREPALGRSVTIDRAAELLGLSRRSIYYRIRDGRLQTVRTLGGSQRVLLQSLVEQGFEPQASSPIRPTEMTGRTSVGGLHAEPSTYR